MARRNLCPNPSAKNDATGWGGTAAPARTTGLTGFPVTTGMQASGTGYITSAAGACGPGDQLVVSLYAQATGPLGAKTVYAAFTRTAGGDDFSQTFSLTVDTTVRRGVATVTAPANATGMYLLLDGITTGTVMTAVMYEPGTVDGGYADGDTSGWAWDGANGNSTSTEQPAQAAPNGIAVPLAVGTPTAALGLAATPSGVAIPAGVGQPTVSIPATAPSGTAVAVALGQPTVGYTLAAAPTGVAVAVHIGTPSTVAAPVTSAPGPTITTVSRTRDLVTQSAGRDLEV